MKKHYRHEHDCLNCGSELQGKYCHNCGQENLQIKESFGHMLNHAISDYFHFDHQFFHTLKPLLLQPGKLTNEYLAGRRAQYLHPVKMYIFISLVYFLLIFKSNHEVVEMNHEKPKSKSEIVKDVKNKLDKEKGLSDAQRKKIEKTVKEVLPITTATSVTISDDGTPLKITDDHNDADKNADSTVAQYKASQQKLPADERDGFWGRFYKQRKLSYREKYGNNASEHFSEDLKHNIPKMMFVLLPLFALILKITFYGNHKYYVEHLIYAIHLHCFFFLLSAIILLIQMLLPANWGTISGWLTTILVFWTIWYIYRSLRTLYQRSRWRTISKMIGMSLMYLIFFSFCLLGLAMATAAAA